MFRSPRIISLVLLVLLCIPSSAFAQLVIASGAGYRAVLNPVVKAYVQSGGEKPELVYGNMARVTAQAKMSGAVDLVLGDKNFLKDSGLEFCREDSLGKGKLVAIYPKGKSFNGPQELALGFRKLAIPDPSRAIYGKAAKEYLENTGLLHKLGDRLIPVSTVPQAAAYLLSGEVDVAFINLTHALKLAPKIGGYAELNEKAYSPISIVLYEMADAPHKDEATAFLAFVQTSEAQTIIHRFGL
ncbi:molybdate ABC transporter substrate-binding protein [Desulfobaculum bizertense]|uniref:molybdate ABC transporter substrate-binding protein n=1 Tax=Desulfobaculum bizertense TaxID=376490 RepID=UPI001F3BA261|nr:molybdate ABC transporter substrate-binding protein [Desulfobaculum bizertense]UIJ38205.1 molybdate ABC transporter substrate-binding protein [Desulfobaculum bizertense]